MWLREGQDLNIFTCTFTFVFIILPARAIASRQKSQNVQIRDRRTIGNRDEIRISYGLAEDKTVRFRTTTPNLKIKKTMIWTQDIKTEFLAEG